MSIIPNAKRLIRHNLCVRNKSALKALAVMESAPQPPAMANDSYKVNALAFLGRSFSIKDKKLLPGENLGELFLLPTVLKHFGSGFTIIREVAHP